MSTANWRAMTLDEIADWILGLVDESPNRLAMIDVPWGTEDELDTMETVLRESYDIAKERRPDLSIKIGPPKDDDLSTAVRVAVHEHAWVGGYCANGCPDKRPFASGLRG